MADTLRADLGNRPASSTSEQAPVTGKILVFITEDWFTLSHFQPLVTTLVGLAREVVVATRSSGRMAEIAALGCRVEPFDLARASLDPMKQATVVPRLVSLIRREKPDVVHVVAMQPMVMVAVAMALVRPRPKLALHLTGLGFLGISQSLAARVIRPVGLGALAQALRRPGSHLLAENPEDAQYLAEGGVDFADRLTILGGAGLDPAQFPPLPPPGNERPVAAFLGRMVKAKGIHHLVAAHALLAERGVALDLALYGKVDPNHPDGIDAATFEAWARRPGITWGGHVTDISGVWARSDIAVMPSVTREGMPRMVLEAAASARPLVVTDVPGCRHFVRRGIDGLIVPPADPPALADALGKLAADPQLRARMGLAARERFAGGFTVAHVADGIRRAYGRLLGST